MPVNLKQFISGKRLLFLVFLLLIFFSTPFGAKWWMMLSFWFFSLLLVWAVGLEGGKEGAPPLKINRWWLLLPVAILIVTRIVPFLNHGEAPLGYDTGIYLKQFESQFADIQSTGFIKNVSPISFVTDILYLLGWETPHILSIFYIILSVFAGLSVYLVAKEYFNRETAFFSLLIFSISVSQFLTYWWFFWKMMLALTLTLTAFYLLKKHSWLVIPVAGFMGAVHLLSLLPFGLAMLLYFILSKEDRKFTFLSGLGILLVVFSISWRDILAYLPYYTEEFGLLRGYPDYLAQELTGQFIDFNLYQGFILIYLPFAILGLVKLMRRREFNYLFFYFLINFAIIYLNLLFHNRFIILLDLIAIVLAGAVLFNFVSRFWSTKFGRTAVIVLLLAAGFNMFAQSWEAKPLVSSDELEEIKSLSSVTEPDAYVMATVSYYSPWVYGYSDRRTIAPGLFEHNKWDLEKWQAFWSTQNLELRHQLLDEYERPLYIYTGDKAGQMDFGDDPGFTRVSKRIWKYVGDGK